MQKGWTPGGHSCPWQQSWCLLEADHIQGRQASGAPEKECQQDIGVWLAVKDEVENQDIELHRLKTAM